MPEIGKTILHYRILEMIGVGGMGEVYRAKDQKLGRDVAIKVLPEEFAKDADRIARFQREAKLLASLNHPNIAAIHGLEEADGTHFLVLELIEGDTLADRLKCGSIPVEEALKLALQIAEALEAAHEKGVIHRDLKPANIKVTPEGKVKILDFGLAKAFAGEQAEVNLSHSPTLSIAATEKGVILGTAAYMSPEQARGETVDKKADVWAFAVILFEMLTGRGIFEGRSVSDVLASVLKSEPEWNSLPTNLHPRIRFLLERCLKKESKNRYSGISDARVDINEVLADPSGVLAQSVATVEPRSKLRMILLWATPLVLMAIIAVAAVYVPSTPKTSICIWDIVRETMTRLTFDEDADNVDPIWTLDGKRILYTSLRESLFSGKGDIYSKAADGTGEAEKLASAPDRGLFPRSWSRDGKNLVVWEFTQSRESGIGLLSMEGDHATKSLLQEKYNQKDPQVSPNGRWMAYASNESGQYEVYVRPFPDVNTGRWLISTSGGNTPLWSPNGRELYYHIGDTAMAVPVETESTFKAGKPTVLFHGTPNIRSTGVDLTDFTYWDISPDGKRFLMVKDATTGTPRKINVVMNWFEELKEKVPTD